MVSRYGNAGGSKCVAQPRARSAGAMIRRLVLMLSLPASWHPLPRLPSCVGTNDSVVINLEATGQEVGVTFEVSAT